VCSRKRSPLTIFSAKVWNIQENLAGQPAIHIYINYQAVIISRWQIYWYFSMAILTLFTYLKKRLVLKHGKTALLKSSDQQSVSLCTSMVSM